MTGNEQELRERLACVGKSLFEKELTYGTSGNISARIPGTKSCLIKPSGYRLCDLRPENFIKIDINTRKVAKGETKPSIETPFHTRLYQERPDSGGIVHIHPKYSTIIGILGREIVPMGLYIYQAPSLAMGIPLSEFAPPGTEKLAENLVKAMKNHFACLMPHHGVTAIGKTVEEAAKNAEIVERLAQLQYEVMVVGEPVPLPESILNIFKNQSKENGLST